MTMLLRPDLDRSRKCRIGFAGTRLSTLRAGRGRGADRGIWQCSGAGPERAGHRTGYGPGRGRARWHRRDCAELPLSPGLLRTPGDLVPQAGSRVASPACARAGGTRGAGRSTWDVPVLYEAPYGIDLPEVAQRTNLTEDAGGVAAYVGRILRLYDRLCTWHAVSGRCAAGVASVATGDATASHRGRGRHDRRSAGLHRSDHCAERVVPARLNAVAAVRRVAARSFPVPAR